MLPILHKFLGDLSFVHSDSSVLFAPRNGCVRRLILTSFLDAWATALCSATLCFWEFLVVAVAVLALWIVRSDVFRDLFRRALHLFFRFSNHDQHLQLQTLARESEEMANLARRLYDKVVTSCGRIRLNLE